MAYKINPNKCIACHTCMGVCPVGAISTREDGKCQIDKTKCITCGSCASVCPVDAISIDAD